MNVGHSVLELYNERMVDLSFHFQGLCWLWSGKKASWHFINLPKEKSAEIQFFNENLHEKKRGWGAVKVVASIGQTTWQTSIFPDKKSGCYILPIKASVRKAEDFFVGSTVHVHLSIDL